MREIKQDIKDDPKVKKILETAGDFYGVTPEIIMTGKARKGSGFELAKIRVFVAYGISIQCKCTNAAIARLFDCSDWNITLYLRRMDKDKEMMVEFNNVFN